MYDEEVGTISPEVERPEIAPYRVRWKFVALILVGAILAAGAFAVARLVRKSSATLAREEVFPAKDWEARPAIELGLTEAALAKLADEVGGDGFISRHGYQAFSWGNPQRKRNFGSAGKVFFSYLLFRAVEAGRLESVDQPVSLHVKELAKLNPQAGYPDSRFTWRQMATQTSCYGVREEPGAAFSYSDFQTMLLGNSLLEKVYHAPWDEVFRQEIAEPLQMQDKHGALPRHQNPDLGWRPMLSPRDMNRFGLLMRHEGRWRGEPQLAAEHASTILHSPLPVDLPNTQASPAEMLPGQGSFGGGSHEEDHGGAFSYFWWLNHEVPGQGRLWPNLPPDALGAVGYGGRCLLMIIPSQDLVVSWVTEKVPHRSHTLEGRHWVNARMQTLRAAWE